MLFDYYVIEINVHIDLKNKDHVSVSEKAKIVENIYLNTSAATIK